MTVDNNSNSYGRDDRRDDDLSYESTGGSNYDYYKSGNEDDLEDEDSSINDSYPGEKKEKRPDEIPEKHESEHEKSGYPRETEYQRPAKSSDASYSEQTDVTPPNPHEFPSVGNAKTDFVSRPHGRTSGRMVGHEPGTEGV